MRRRWMLLCAAPMLAIGALAMRGSAQQTPPMPGEGGPPPTTMPGGEDDGGRGMRGGPDDGGRGGMRGGPDGMRGGPFGDRGPFGRGGGGGGGGGPGGMMDRRMPSMDVMRGYMELVDRYTRLASDPDAAGVSAVLAANDLLRAKGNDAAIAYFVKTLDAAPRPAVQRAIRIQLIDLYKAAGKTDQAIEQIEILIKAPVGN